MNKLFKRITISVFLFLSMFVIITPTSAEEEVIEKKLYVLDTSIENEISYEDMITEIAEMNGISYQESETNLLAQKVSEKVENNPNLRTALVSKTLYKTLEDQARVEMRATTYVTNVWQLSVRSDYHPTLHIYFQAQTTDRSAVKILNVSMNRKSNDSSWFPLTKQFSGSIYYNLETKSRVFIQINGDFYNKGTTNVGAGISVGVGESTKVSLSVSSASGHFKYFFKEKKYPIAVGVCPPDPDFIK